MSGFLIVPSALIQASGMASLNLSELRLFWRIIGAVATHDPPSEDDQTVLKLVLRVSDYLEPGEDKLERLAERLAVLTKIQFRANLDGREKGPIWRKIFNFIVDAEINSELIEVSIGPKMAKAIRDRAAFAVIRESVLFNMRNSKYSALLYVLIRDKANLKQKKWEVELPYFREVMQLSEGIYPHFDGMKKRILDPAVKEISEFSEFTLHWSKGRTYKNAVRSLVFTWEAKDGKELRQAARESRRHSTARGKTPMGDAPPLISLTDRAVKWLMSADFRDRMEWAERAIALGQPRALAPITPSKTELRKWAGLVAPEMREKGLIRD